MKYIKYLKYIIKHKWYVMFECFKVGLIWRGLAHDFSKLFPDEFIPYANHFYGKGRDISYGRDDTGYYKPTDTGDKAFDFAWLLHQKRNRHHWQYHLITYLKICYNNKSDLLDKEIICDYRNPIKIKSFANYAENFFRLKNFLHIKPEKEEHNEGSYVKNIGKNIVKPEERKKKSPGNGESTIKKDIGIIRNTLEKKRKEKLGNIENYALSIMGGILLFVNVVVNNNTSFCALTILTEAEPTIESNSKKKELLYIVGLLNRDSRLDTEFFVPIAIRHMGLMDIAHTSEINKSDYTLPIFLENEDKIKILEIEHPYNMEMLCDWVGAAKAQGKFPPKDDKYFYTRKWYSAHKNKMQLHPNTREFIEKTIGIGKENA